MTAGVEERSAPAPRIARALPARGVCSPRTAGRGSWLLGARPAPPGQAPGSGRPERRRPWSRHGAPSSANRHRAACRARGRGGAAGLAACPGVPAWAAEPRAGPARTSEAVCQAEIHPLQVGGKRRKVPRPSARRRAPAAAAAAELRHPDPPGLSPPAGSSGDHAGKVAAHDSHRLPSLTH